MNKPGELVDIPGSPARRYVTTDLKYDHKKDKSQCPVCGGIGVPWHGWFSCGDCEAIALVTEGTAFLPAPQAKEKA